APTGLTLSPGSGLNIDLASATSSDQISAGGTINLNGATLNVASVGSFVPATGQTFTIIKNTGTTPISGTFAGLPEGAKLSGAGAGFTISYKGGAGNDVVLTAQTVGAATHLSVTPSVTTAPTNTPVTFTVSALDANNFVAAGYSGTVKFSSSDTAATLPANATLKNGTGTFDVTFKTGGSQTLTATD